jgi:hypothetical protein
LTNVVNVYILSLASTEAGGRSHRLLAGAPCPAPAVAIHRVTIIGITAGNRWE